MACTKKVEHFSRLLDTVVMLQADFPMYSERKSRYLEKPLFSLLL